MNEMNYKGYIIKAVPDQLAENGRWTTDVSIIRHRTQQTTEQRFSAGNTYDTKEEATQHCLDFGKRVIDGRADVSLDES